MINLLTSLWLAVQVVTVLFVVTTIVAALGALLVAFGRDDDEIDDRDDDSGNRAKVDQYRSCGRPMCWHDSEDAAIVCRAMREDRGGARIDVMISERRKMTGRAKRSGTVT